MTFDAFSEKNVQNGILPYAKRSGLTSFASLACIKRALHTKKVGHTGTLDSFADGLLVVLSGSFTHLVPYFTLFDKSYEALIAFGEETDTLDPCGTVVRRAPLPDVRVFERTCCLFCGNLMQSPPAYSALHVNGKRASDLARAGMLDDLPERPVTVYKSEVLETQLTAESSVRYARVFFRVSKGTYIRSLARDIGRACASAAHLIGLRRTAVGCFHLEQAAFTDKLGNFTVDSVIRRRENPPVTGKIGGAAEGDSEYSRSAFDYGSSDYSNETETIRRSLINFTSDIAEYCGFIPLKLRAKCRFDFINGKPLKADFFENFKPSALHGGPPIGKLPMACNAEKAAACANCAVFLPEGTFAGIITVDAARKNLKYGFVVPTGTAPHLDKR